MPESRHRRGGQTRPRPRELEPQKVKPKPSPRWVPIVGLALIFLGVGIIIANYVWISQNVSHNYYLLGGFALLAVGFGVLTQWR